MAVDEIGNLPDVHLEQAASDDEANHGPEDSGTLGLGHFRGHSSGATANWTANCLHQMTTLRSPLTSVPDGTS